MTAKIGTTKIGSVVEPYTCFDPLFHIMDASDNVKWKIHTDCCQCGVFCRGCCGKLSTVVFPIYSGDKKTEDFKVENSSGRIKKKCGGFHELFTDANYFTIKFPVNATPEEKFLLIATTLMIDYRYYEDTGDKNNMY
jgi:hypothetical protein